MSIRKNIFLSLCLISAVVFSACSPRHNRESAPPPPPAMTEEEMMAKWKEASTPSAGHEYLKKLVGKWNTTSTFWKDPSAKPEVTKGTAENKMILGNRYLMQSYKGKFMGHPFEGVGLTGFDNMSKEYQSVWIDSMLTSMMNSKGSMVNEDLELHASGMCPISGEMIKSREVIRIVSKNEYIFTMFNQLPGDSEVKAMEIVYKRK